MLPAAFTATMISATAIASLSGPPLTERRFWSGLAGRAADLGRPELASGLLDLLLPEPVPAETWQAWQAPWSAALAAAGKLPDCPPRLHPARRAYYERAAAALAADQPAPAAWLALRTWTQAAGLLPAADPARAAWQSALLDLGLSAAGFTARLEAFDAYLDHLEEILDNWGRSNGI